MNMKMCAFKMKLNPFKTQIPTDGRQRAPEGRLGGQTREKRLFASSQVNKIFILLT